LFCEPFGFGKIVHLGEKDELIHHRFLRIYTDDIVGFVLQYTGAKNPFHSEQLEELSFYSVSEDGHPLKGLDILGFYVNIINMGHDPKAYFPITFEAVVFIKLPKHMLEGKSYTFQSHGLIETDIDVTFTWSYKEILSEAIKVNQIGYLSDANIRLAYFGKWLGTAGSLGFIPQSYEVIDLDNGKIVYSGKPGLRHSAGQKNEGAYQQDFSGENVYSLDLSFLEKGVYCISIQGVGRSYSFQVADDVMAEPLFTSIRALYHQRCGIELEEKFTFWTRPKCKKHIKLPLMPEYHFGYCSKLPNNIFERVNQFLRQREEKGNLEYRIVKGGYHDAGDYDRNPSHLRIANVLCTAYDINPEAFIDEQFIIPESGNGIPDILDEADFLLSFYLQNQWQDGGIPSGTESNKHPQNANNNGWLTNTENEINEYVILPVTQMSCFDFAAGAAHLGLELRAFPEVKDKSDKYINAAQKAFESGMKNFPPKNLEEQLMAAYAAARLLAVTLKQEYAEVITTFEDLITQKKDYMNPAVLWFVSAYSSIPENTPGLNIEFQNSLKKNVSDTWNWALNKFFLKEGYLHFKHSWAPFTNGTGSVGQADLIILAWMITGNEQLLDMIKVTADFCLGANPLGKVMCSGLGQNHILHPLVLESMNDDIKEYVPGIWVYGPIGNKEHWLQKQYESIPPFKETPLLYRYIGIDQCPMHTEFTVQETLSKAVMLFGVLAAKNPKPYTEPLPKPD